ncbi:MAG TPA: oxygen-independent coproporphyrinogen III oxidase [Chiayiivirga sp.]|jgi:oxygen-independent coproporphyrinogen-3 oxidase|uniref:Coproporphyrinogen-III oxidase n=1 Tax=Denitratimonas tolerans TaxID=1338420 RepID=A0AAW9R923_9GAMM|nr:oxygen-independent coproporphyrinogen III oxidase [Xanthomonadaceae bacterium]MDX9764333.1 oxygen-independent coproporphyrinogen III oxidase [Chiayiivirga sp.]HRN60081.1 oxygen-independent coproporphyrinogen III oxidase [Chiayiivirga sp.]HRO86857.1 oxygen-independent coproporphyrinogen III oxidase [Chiayiivirga sp.]HRQ34696.1 oxygen-independent coproporphyrinogen III oxidase [Chiayiivirga sp.]
MATPLFFSDELLQRYDRPGPRYTSYPAAPRFHEGFGDRELREHIALSNEDPVPHRLSLYVHIPFCESPCFYCGCNRIITRDHRKGAAYLAALDQEIERVGPLFDRDREVIQLHLGGGTPNFMTPAQLGALLDSLGRHFSFSATADRDYSIELDPRHVTPDEIGELARLGFNRASLGVQDFDPVVQEAVNRIQGVEMTLDLIRACRTHGLRSVNVDLIYGLPKQTVEGFGRTLDTVLEARPDRLAIYGYAHLPEVFRAQTQLKAEDLPSAATRLALLRLAIEKLTAAGYEHIGMDHFALPEDELAKARRSGSLHRNFMGYTTHAETDLIGLGVSAISHIGASFSQNPRDLGTWEARLAHQPDALPVWRGLSLDADDRLRADVIGQIMCLGEIDIREVEAGHGIDFREYFRAALARLEPMVADGLVEITRERVRATPRGQLLLRHVAMAFDAYLHERAEAMAPARFSKAI